jgi:hypothetical protein
MGHTHTINLTNWECCEIYVKKKQCETIILNGGQINEKSVLEVQH